VVSVKGAAGVRYHLEADKLDLTNPVQSPIPLSGITVGTSDGNVIIADATGNANAVQPWNCQAATFVRARAVP
jgi:hypothetical protein